MCRQCPVCGGADLVDNREELERMDVASVEGGTGDAMYQRIQELNDDRPPGNQALDAA
jgi:hypothetical protein